VYCFLFLYIAARGRGRLQRGRGDAQALTAAEVPRYSRTLGRVRVATTATDPGAAGRGSSTSPIM
jgi:hypothetical protein